jgi:Holliday junction resolvasome RuvABC endonuclease subunit
MRILGIDPGVQGAFALLDTITQDIVIDDMPVMSFTSGTAAKPRQHRHISEQLVAEIIIARGPDVAWIELVHAMPKQGVTSSFNFGVSFGIIRGVLAGRQVPIEFVTPQNWKRAFQLGADKQQARIRAANLFPKHAELFRRRCDDGRAEALLLAAYGAREPI